MKKKTSVPKLMINKAVISQLNNLEKVVGGAGSSLQPPKKTLDCSSKMSDCLCN